MPAQGIAHTHLPMLGMSPLIILSPKDQPMLGTLAQLAPPWDTFLGTLLMWPPTQCSARQRNLLTVSRHLQPRPHPLCLSFGPNMPIRFPPLSGDIGARRPHSHVTLSLAYQLMPSLGSGRPLWTSKKVLFLLKLF